VSSFPIETQAMIKVMQHFEDGGEVEVSFHNDAWTVIPVPIWDWRSRTYRIKATPEYVPYTVETFPKGMVWVKEQTWVKSCRSLITSINYGDVWFDRGSVVEYDELLVKYKISLDGGETWEVAGVLK
jgi:hypothetical protein